MLGELLRERQVIDARALTEHRGVHGTRADDIGGDPGAGQTGGQAAITPATATAASTRPNRARAVATARSTSSWKRTSPGTATAFGKPVASAVRSAAVAALAASAGSVGASSRTSRHPASDSRRATAAPRPRAPPVTTATGAPMLSTGGSLLGEGNVMAGP